MKTVLLAMNEVPLNRNMNVWPLIHMQILLVDRDVNTMSLKIHGCCASELFYDAVLFDIHEGTDRGS